jgi:hypothetical protein
MGDKGFSFHVLKNEERVAITSPHGFKFTDGTEAIEGASREATDMITVERQMVEVRPRLTASKLSLGEEALATLADLNQQAEWVIVPFMVLSALREMGLRDDPRFSNVVAYNATAETRRLAPQDKVVDIDNFAW